MKKGIISFVSVLFILASTFAFPAMQAEASPPDNTLLQFTSGGHVLGFTPNRVYMAGMGHALTDDLFFMLLDKYATFCVTQMEV